MNLYLPVPADLDAAATCSGDGWTSAVVCFDASWRPHVTPVGPLPGEKGYRSPGHDVARSLQASLAAIGIHRRALGWRINRARLVILAKFLLLIPALALVIHLLILINELGS